MLKGMFERKVTGVLESSGIEVNGARPWDIKVYDPRFYRRVLFNGSLGLGESYMEGWWDCEDIDNLFFRLMRANVGESDLQARSLAAISSRLVAWVKNLQSRVGSGKVIKQHYDLGNDFYMSFLDAYNQYTCGYFDRTDDLEIAQRNKLELQCRKLGLTSSDHVLEIGCGWGGFSKYAAEHYGCRITALTLSEEQASYARDFCRGLPVDILVKDYRDITGRFDKVLVCGMIEHVGAKNYGTLMEVISRSLNDQGLFLLQTIGNNYSVSTGDPWVTKYIFPNSMLPSMEQLSAAAATRFILEDVHNFGTHYAKTLRCWHKKFEANWPKFSSRFGERFERMWRYYLLSFAGCFDARFIQLWQLVLSKEGRTGGYRAVRTAWPLMKFIKSKARRRRVLLGVSPTL